MANSGQDINKKTILSFDNLDELGCKVLCLRSIILVDSRFFFGNCFDAFGENFSKLEPSFPIFLPTLLISGRTNGSRDDSRLHSCTSRIISSLSFGHNSKILPLVEPTILLNIIIISTFVVASAKD